MQFSNHSRRLVAVLATSTMLPIAGAGLAGPSGATACIPGAGSCPTPPPVSCPLNPTSVPTSTAQPVSLVDGVTVTTTVTDVHRLTAAKDLCVAYVDISYQAWPAAHATTTARISVAVRLMNGGTTTNPPAQPMTVAPTGSTTASQEVAGSATSFTPVDLVLINP